MVLTIQIKRNIKTTPVYNALWNFASERQEIFFRRIQNISPPWTLDPILAKYKFTNVYRASDRVSQYLIKNVIYEGSQDISETFFRIMLFKTFNKIETWELLKENISEIAYASYSFAEYDKILTQAMSNGIRIYSAAYMMSSGRSMFGNSKKHRNHLRLIEMMMRDETAKKISECKTMRQAFELLLSFPTIGNFLAFQYTIDINYSNLTNFSEMEFVVPGPGALDGIKKCFYDSGGLNQTELIKWMAEKQETEFDRLGIKFKTLWGRHLQLIDCQNLFCEISKYSRVAFPEIQGLSKRTRIKQLFSPKQTAISYWFPPKWGINDKIQSEMLTATAK